MTDQNTNGRTVRLLAVLLLFALTGGSLWWWARQGPPNVPLPVVPPQEDASLTPAEAREIVRQKNLGLGYLENGSLGEAIDTFSPLAERLPDEVLPTRNLAVAAVLEAEAVDIGDATALSSAITRAQQALAAAATREAASLPLTVLRARLAVREEDLPTAIRLLSEARDLDPSDLPTAYELYSVGSPASDEESQRLARQSLDDAFRLSPTNLVILLERLQVQAREQDPKILETLQAGGPRWEQLAPGVQQRVRVDLLKIVANAQEAAEAGDWPLVIRNVLLLRNVVTPEEATRSDRRLVQRHALEFVLDTYSPRFLDVLADSATRAEPVPIRFVAETGEPGLFAAGSVREAQIADIDLDGAPDICTLSGDAFQTWSRSEFAWELIAQFTLERNWTGFVTADLDDDVETTRQRTEASIAANNHETAHPTCHFADLDLILFGPDGIAVYRNDVIEQDETRLSRSFAAVALPEALATTARVEDLAVCDLDSDGDLDLLCLQDSGPRLWSNRGNWTFEEMSSLSGAPTDVRFQSVLPLDWDQDLDLDVLLGSDTGGLWRLENLRHGEFQWQEVGHVPESDSAIRVIEPIDNQGSWDLLLGSDDGLFRAQTATPLPGRVTLEGLVRLSELPGSELLTADLNNDSWPDIAGSNADDLHLWRGAADGRFELTDDAISDLPAPTGSTTLDAGDLDQDGRVDLVLARIGSPPLILYNRGADGQSWLEIGLMAQQVKGNDLSASGRVNHYGLGSVIELRDGARRQRQVVRRPRTHFGLGASTQADTVRVLWPNGVPENLIHPAPRTLLCEQQALKGSCPYLYAWNGQEFTFVTDLLWSAPIGMVGTDGRIVPDRPWEHLKIDGRFLQPHGDRYELRITEELWEVAYFDRVELLAIDHPADVDIFSNEKVGPAEIAAHRIHTVRTPRLPVRATDQQGRDVLPLLSEADDRYARLFDIKHRQGYTEDTQLELDLGPLDGAERITLFLTGWIYPGDTTINVALSQNPDLPGPRPPALWIPDAAGTWHEAVPFTGFPGGKTKTIAVDLSGLFSTEDYRLRLTTSSEIYWDQIFFTADEEPVDIRETRLPLTRADLRSRGVSRRIVHPQHGPERYDYSQVSPSPWRPMWGRFTRLGDVRELLTDEDDRLVVMGSGDEVVLEFAVPEDPLPQGWERDFILRNVGWDKDADLHTIYGQTVEPLPRVGMSRYPPPPEEAPLGNPRMERYLDEYQTRTMWPGWPSASTSAPLP